MLLLCAAKLTADPTTAFQAEKVVHGWLKVDRRPLDTVLDGQISHVETFTDNEGEPIYYVVYLKPSGFVIVSADDLVEPIIGFAKGGTYDPSFDNPLGALVSRDLPCRITAARNLQSAIDERVQGKNLDFQQAASQISGLKAQKKWADFQDYADTIKEENVFRSGKSADYKSDAPGLPSISDVYVAPLVQSQWSQGSVCLDYCYDYYTPGPHYLCGCVATAMAQLMRFFEYPTDGIGIHTFIIKVDGTPQDANTRGGDGEGGPYNWDQMMLVPDCNITTIQRQAIGALCYDAGVSAHTVYNAGGSGSTPLDAKNALINTFLYSNAVNGTVYSVGTNLNEMINPNLDTGYPVFLAISCPTDGHAILTDGYGFDSSALYHHLKMGWSSWYDVWYNLPNMAECYAIFGCIYNIFTAGSGEIISGRVTDSSTGAPIRGVMVTAQGPGGPYIDVTDDRGIYALAKVSSGSSFTVSASKNGWNISDPIEVTTGISTDNTYISGNVWGVNFQGTLNQPFIQLSAEEFEFSVIVGDTESNPQTLFISNIGTGTLNWVINYDCNWLEVAPDAGSSTGEIDEVILNVTNLTPGSHNCELTVSDPCAANSPRTIWVNLLVGDMLLVPSQYPNIQAAIDDARDVDMVVVATGIYTGEGNRDLDFKGKSITVRSESGPELAIIDCQNSGRGFGFHNGEDSNSVVEGFTVTNGSVSSSDTFYGNGGGIYCEESSPTIANCIFSANWAENSGGGMYNTLNSCPMLTNCIFKGNTTYNGPGGGMCNREGSSPTIDNCMFQGNSGHKGAAIYNWNNACPMLTNCTFSGNSAAEDGGGMYNFNDSSPTLINCVFSENLTICDGGGIYNVDNANPTLMTNCTFSGNSADDNGGGMYNNESSPTLTNCTFSQNSAGDLGGGIYNYRADTILTNCAFSRNSAGARGGGIYSRRVQSTLINCIMWADSAAQGDEIYLAFYSDTRPTIVTVSYSDIEGGYAGAYVETGCTLNWDDGNNLDVDPCFADLCNGDYHLKSHAGRWYPSIYTAMDPTGDSFIDLSDFAAFANYWQQVGESVPADFDNSGTVDLSDLNLLLDNYLADYPTGEWVTDDVTSPCIDAGEPNSDWTEELWPHGERINMGAYGGTAQASMSLSTAGNKADLDRDGDVDGDDLALLVGMWLVEEVLLSEDINRNGSVNFSDFTEFAGQWRWEE